MNNIILLREWEDKTISICIHIYNKLAKEQDSCQK